MLHAGIRLAGATNDVHVFDVRTGTWSKITPLGEPPSPRAAHAAAAVGAMVVVQVRGRHGSTLSNMLECILYCHKPKQCMQARICPTLYAYMAASPPGLQGGIGPAGLASEDLHVLDFTDMDRPRWHRCGNTCV